MSFKNISTKGFVGFVPHCLDIKERPELNIFPRNVLFADHGTRNGKNVMGDALYEPDLESYSRKRNRCSMKYHNVDGGNHWLVIKYDFLEKRYQGEKFVNGKSVGQAFGQEWNMFFVHITMLGLSVGERCKFEEIGLFIENA